MEYINEHIISRMPHGVRALVRAGYAHASGQTPSLNEVLGPDSPVAPEDRGAGVLRGAGARSPLFWKLMLAGVALVWGFSFFVMKDTLDALPTFLLLACRFLTAAAIMFALFARRVVAHLNRRTIAVGLLMGLFMWGGYGLQTLGLVETTAGKNAFLTGAYCVLVPFISYVMSREPLTRYNLGAAFLCLGDIGLVALDSLVVNRGDLLTLGGAVFFALEMAVVSKYGRDMDVNVLTFWMFFAVGALSAVASVLTEVPPALSVWNAQLLGTIAFLAVFCTCVCLLIQNVGLAHVPSSTGSLLLSLESPSGVLFSVIFAHEVLSGRALLGFALIFCSIVVSETHLSFLRRHR